jgi:predicted TIM-barrel fold metal-dependent hydrolase
MATTRREFIQQSLATGTAAAITYGVCKPQATQAAEADLLPIIDTHQHLWDLETVRPPWLAGAAKVLAKPYATREYLAATNGLPVVKAVYMEVDVDPQDQLNEAHHVIGLCKNDHPTVAAVIGGRPNSDHFAAYIKQFANNSDVKGVRQVLHGPTTPAGFCLRSQFGKSMKLLGELSKSFDICIRPAELGDALTLVKAHPDTRFILDHCGNADPKAFLPSDKPDSEPWHDKDQWLRDITALGACDNLICKISGIVARAPEGWQPEQLAPIINHCLDSFGPDRVVFGGDWPVCLLGATYAQWVNGLKAVVSERPVEQRRKLFHDNAERIYGLT